MLASLFGCGDHEGRPQGEFDRTNGGAEASDGPRIFAQYHLWYSKGDVATPGYDTWNGWSQTSSFMAITGGVSPEHFETPWRRVTGSRLGTPLTGPYSSITDLDTIEYHLESAKAAGIDGMFASVYDGRWNDIFASHLDVAQGVGLGLGMELYHGVGPDRPVAPPAYRQQPMVSNGCRVGRGFQRVALIAVLDQFRDHPAYLHIDGRPAVWIANAPRPAADWEAEFPGSDCTPRSFFSWGNRAELQSLFDDVRNGFTNPNGEFVAGVGEDFSVVLTGPMIDDVGESFADIGWITHLNGASNINAFWNTFGVDVPMFRPLDASDRGAYESAYQADVRRAQERGGAKAALHTYPAFDERGLFPTDTDRGSGLDVPRTVIDRNGNGMYPSPEGFLAAALDVAAQENMDVFVESWNDWNEQTQIEPALHQYGHDQHQDPFAALRRIAEFKGLGEVAFALPPLAALDAPLVDTGRYRQWQGLDGLATPNDAVRLEGTFGLAQGADGSDGVVLGLSYLDASGVWRSIGRVEDGNDQTLRNFSFDLTEVRDRPLVLGVESGEHTAMDWAHITSLRLNWYGQVYDLLDASYLGGLHWHSSQGTVNWGEATAAGTARIAHGVTMEDGSKPAQTLYMHPDFDPGGFMHAGLDLEPADKPQRVRLRGRLGYGQGASGSDGFGLQVYYLDDDRSHQSPSELPATRWVSEVLVEKQYDDSLKSFTIDITHLLDKPAIGFGIESLGHSNSDWAYIAELELDWYGVTIDLLRPEILGQMHWHGSQGSVGWGENGPRGSAVLTDATLEDGQSHRALYMHPDWNAGGFMHTGLDFRVLQPWLQ